MSCCPRFLSTSYSHCLSLCLTFPSPSSQALLPVAGVPLIEYQLEHLASQAGLKLSEVLVFVVKGVAAVRSYLSSSRWAGHLVTEGAPTAGLASPRVRLVTAPDCESPGAALRALDAMQAVRASTLIVVEGGALTNVALGAAVAAQTARQAADDNCIATIVTIANGPAGMPPGVSADPRRATAARFTIDPSSGLLLALEMAAPGSPLSPPLPPKALKRLTPGVSAPLLLTEAAVTDARLYVCSPAFLVHFSDNYDYRHIRAQYLANECQNTELGFSFHVHVAAATSGAWVARVEDPRTLEAASASLLAGRAPSLHPLGPWWRAPGQAGHWRRCTVPGTAAPGWAASDADVAPDAAISGGSLVFSGAVLGPGVAVARGSVVCARASVGAGATLNRCAIGPGASIGAGVTAEGAIVAAGVVVGEGASLGAGVVLGPGVIIAPGTAVPPHTRIAATPYIDPFASEEEAAALAAARVCEPAVVGSSGVGRIWPAPEEWDPPADALDDSDDDDDEESDEESDDEEAGGRRAGGSAGAGASAAAVAAASAARVAALSRLTAAAAAATSGAAAATIEALVALRAAFTEAAALPPPSVLASAGTGAASAPHAALLASAAALLASAPKPAKAAAAAAPAAGAAKAAATTAPSASSSSSSSRPNTTLDADAPPPDRSRSGPAWQAFAAGVRDLIFARPLTPENRRNMALEVKSFKYAENRTLADCAFVIVGEVARLVSEAWEAAGLLAPLAPLGARFNAAKPLLDAWGALLLFFQDATDEAAPVAALASYVASAPPGLAAAWTDAFGPVVYKWRGEDVFTDLGVSAWAGDAEEEEEGSVARTLLGDKWVVRTLAEIDEEGEDEDDEEDDEDEDEEEDDE